MHIHGVLSAEWSMVSLSIKIQPAVQPSQQWYGT